MSDITIICGPTASGKSAFAMHLAKQTNGVIINADSCQVYKELPILTASPSDADKTEVPHYLYNFLSIQEDFSVAKYLPIATQTVEQIQSQGIHPIIVGGTGLYIKALLHGLSHIPDINNDTRNQARQDFDVLGKEEFYARLVELDPTSASAIKAGDSQRMIRAYEVLMQTGESIATYQNHKVGGLKGNISVIMLSPERKFLYETCNQRFASLILSGGMDEVKSILPLLHHKTPKILGLQELASYLYQKMSLSDAVIIAQAKTRQYAKRQVTWFTHQIQDKTVLPFGSRDEFAGLLAMQS